MSSPSTVNSLISKLLSLPNQERPLIFNSQYANDKYNELKTLVPDLYIEDLTFRAVAGFLQFISLSMFTTDELRALLKFDYSHINHQRITPDLDKQDLTKPQTDINGQIVNLSFRELNSIETNFKKLISINKKLTVEYLVSYIVSQT